VSVVIDEQAWRQALFGARRVVIKLGTGTVTNERGEICHERVDPIVRSISELRKDGRQIVLVSSGAVGMGAGHLGLPSERLNDVVTKQACAAVGQGLLMNAYGQLFRAHDIRIAQILLTEGDFAEWQRYQTLRQTIERLLKLDVLPIVNENDTVSIAELERIGSEGNRVFSDNDRLASLVMSKLGAEVLVLLTNVDGLLSKAPNSNDAEHAQVIPFVDEITASLTAMAAGPAARGRGGMTTKLEAAQIAMRSGICVIANGAYPETLTRLFAGERTGTVFAPGSRMGGKRGWIAFATNVRGRLTVNSGAREALLGGKGSLLASGVIAVEDKFAAKDVVGIVDIDGHEFARGVINCDSAETLRMIAASATRPQRAKDHVLIARENIVMHDIEQRAVTHDN